MLDRVTSCGVVNWHIGRCGSSVLGSLLDQHPDVGYSNEIFSPYMPRRRGEKVLPTMEQVVLDSREGFTADVHLFEVKHLPAQNLGLYPSLSAANWLEVFGSLGYQRHILLHRRNGLRRMVSHIRAAESGVYVASAGPLADQPLPKLTLPLEGIRHGFEVRSLLGWLQEYDRGWQEMQTLFSQCARDNSDFRWLSLTYEDDLAQSPFEGYQRVRSFLGLAEFEPNLRCRKLNSGSLPELIANWDEIRALLTPTPFAWMLEC